MDWFYQWKRFDSNETFGAVCELHFEGTYLKGEKCTLEWSMNPVPTIYPQKLLIELSSLLT